MDEQNLWLMEGDSETCGQILAAIDFDISNRVRNINELVTAFVGVIKTKPFTVPADLPLPEGFIRPEVWLPPLDFSPDYFSLAGLSFVSRRFRDALAQPEGVVQYWPIHLARGSEEARAQDYMLFRILAWQPALDWGRSVCERDEFTNRRTGEHLVAARRIERFVPLDGLVPRTEILPCRRSPHLHLGDGRAGGARVASGLYGCIVPRATDHRPAGPRAAAVPDGGRSRRRAAGVRGAGA